MTVQTAILKVPEKIQFAQAHWSRKSLGVTMTLRKHVPRDARQLLEASGVEWEVRSGSRHFKVFVGGRFVAILPHAKPASKIASRAHQNMLAQIKRAIRSHHD
jgi:hypothetical protein